MTLKEKILYALIFIAIFLGVTMGTVFAWTFVQEPTVTNACLSNGGVIVIKDGAPVVCEKKK